MIIARIGVAKRTHGLDRYSVQAGWGTSICGKWAGRVSVDLVDVIQDGSELKAISCRECLATLALVGRENWITKDVVN